MEAGSQIQASASVIFSYGTSGLIWSILCILRFACRENILKLATCLQNHDRRNISRVSNRHLPLVYIEKIEAPASILGDTVTDAHLHIG